MITWIQNQDLATGHVVRKKQRRYGAPVGASKVIPQVQMNLLCLCQGLFCDFAVTSQLPFVCGSFRDLLSSALLSMTSFPSGLNQILVFLSLTIDISAVATSCGLLGTHRCPFSLSVFFQPIPSTFFITSRLSVLPSPATSYPNHDSEETLWNHIERPHAFSYNKELGTNNLFILFMDF